ncbi:uncharacterized protein LOC131639756 [Vicia villosa]|uniref:uncharacterized protein LOC131639756 n=1 Tax=Vicia villosa TaxID=3911 RepID=UPI00273C92C1|nr:uncharacterized protein LOC131639756 [Vicia villosa]
MEWQRVQKRNFRAVQSKWDCFPFNGGRWLGVEESVSSFFFSDFPTRVRAKDIFELFGCHREVVEVVIPPRSIRNGKRFGFARFVAVADARILAVRLDNILIDGRKIHANIPRYERKLGYGGLGQQGGGKRGGGVSLFHEGNKVAEAVKVNKYVGIYVGRSFADVVSNEKAARQDEEGKALVFKASEEEKIRLSEAYVGVISNPGSSYNIQTYFEMEGVFSIKVTPVGANLCLLEEMEEGYIGELIGDGSTWWKQWFIDIKPWKSPDVDEERVSWIRINGIPCHPWCAEFFMMLANSFGSFICLDENTANKSCLDIV